MGLFVIGDVHGELEMLRELWDKITPHFDSNTKICFVGDYVDRGPNSKGVVDFVIEKMKSHNVTPLLGNHEDMLLRDHRTWVMNGGYETLESYNWDRKSMDIRDIVGLQHYKFYNDLPYYAVFDSVAVTHAGLDDIKLEDKLFDPFDIIWSRRCYRGPRKHYKFTVHGHTPLERVNINEYSAFIDTGAVFGYSLTALYIPDTVNPNWKEMRTFSVKHNETRGT